MTQLAQQFEQAMFDIYRRAKDETGYKPSIFFGMLTTRGGLQTAKTLINSPKPSDGYTKLNELGRLDLTVEAVIADNPAWHPLFTDAEPAKARARLKAYGHKAEH